MIPALQLVDGTILTLASHGARTHADLWSVLAAAGFTLADVRAAGWIDEATDQFVASPSEVSVLARCHGEAHR